MKYLKMLGLVAVAAMTLAFACADMASATTLENGTSPYVHPNVIDASLVGSAILESTGGSVLYTCTESTIEGTPTTGSATETVRGVVSSAGFIWGGCTTTIDTIQGGEIEIHHIPGTSNGTVTISTFEKTVAVFGTSCIYGFTNNDTMTHLGTLIGDDHTPKIEINTIVVERTEDKFICPNDVRWTATYHVTTPTGLTVTAG